MTEEIIKVENNKIETSKGVYKRKTFLIEDSHPAIGRILIVDNKKFKIMDEPYENGRANETYIAPLTEEDEQTMKEYDESIEELSELLVSKVDVKRLIKENIKLKTPQEIQAGIYILEKEQEGEEIEVEHHKGCYHFKIHYKNLVFDFASGEEH